MSEPLDPMPPGDPLAGRLSSYFDDLDSHEMPRSLQQLSAADVVARPGAAPTRWLSGSGRVPMGLIAVGIAAAMLVAIIGTTLRRGDEQAIEVGDHGSTGTSAPVPAPASTVPGGVTTPDGAPVGGPGTTAPVETTPDGSVIVNPGSTTTAPFGPNPGTPTNPGGNPANPGATTTVPNPVTTPPTQKPTTTLPVTTTTAPPACPILLCEDFADDEGHVVPAGWAVDSGDWYIANAGGVHFAKSNLGIGTESRMSSGSNAWTNYEITATVKFGSGAKWGGVASHYQDAANYLFCKVDAASGKLYSGRYVGGVATGGGSTTFAPTAYVDYTIRMRVQNGVVSCSIDGQVAIANWTDGTWTSGRIAIISEGQGALTHIRVTAT